MITFTMRREGQFVTNFSTSNNQCGKAGQQIYRYVCEIEVGEQLDKHGFILDNYKVQEYFDAEYRSAVSARSCEQIALRAAEDFQFMLASDGRTVHRVSVTIYGSEFAGLTAVWTAPAAQKTDARDVNAPPIDVQFDYAEAEQRVQRMKSDPGTTLFGMSLSEIRKRIDFWDEAHAPVTITKSVQPEQVLCDYCKQPIELDGGDYNRGHSEQAGREDYRHVGTKRYSCDLDDGRPSRAATVNGEHFVVKNKPVPAQPVCDHCGEPVQLDDKVGIKGRLAWSHIDGYYTCLTSPYKFAAVKGNEHILQSELMPSRDNHEHNFVEVRTGAPSHAYARCTVCHMSDVYLYGKHGARGSSLSGGTTETRNK